MASVLRNNHTEQTQTTGRQESLLLKAVSGPRPEGVLVMRKLMLLVALVAGGLLVSSSHVAKADHMSGCRSGWGGGYGGGYYSSGYGGYGGYGGGFYPGYSYGYSSFPSYGYSPYRPGFSIVVGSGYGGRGYGGYGGYGGGYGGRHCR